MLYAKRLSLRNFLRFRGEHVLELSPLVYGVASRSENDPERSNGNGKSSLLEAFSFALYGQHRWPTEDDWISKGEKDGGITLELSDGTEIVRSRKRGAATRLSVDLANGVPPNHIATQDAAQAIIERELTGFSWQDFEHTCWFEQKRMSRFVVARQAERTAIVAGWFDLEPLRAAHAGASVELGSAIEEEHRLLASKGSRDAFRREMAGDGSGLAGDGISLGWAEIEARAKDRIEGNVEEARIARENAEGLSRRIEELRDWERKVVEADEHAKAIAKVAKLEAEAPPSPSAKAIEEAKKARAHYASELRVAADKRRSADLLAKGEFDGRCPVAGIDCPVRADINADRERGRSISRGAQKVEADAKAKASAAENEERRLLALGKAADEHAASVRVANALAARTLASADFVAKHGGFSSEDRAELEQERKDHLSEEARANAAIEAWKREMLRARENAARELEDEKKLAAVRKRIATAREAIAILGPAGAQRRVAERELAEVDRGANELLDDCGIDLRVRAAWGRETKGLAPACSSCGAPFPASAKVKECQRCGEPRGQKIEEKLDVELSRRSGGLEDVAGIGLELSAAAWLRARRGSRWGLALVDEPFGALDSFSRRALSRGFLRLLNRRFAFCQALIVSHGSDVDDYPGRIVVVAKGDRSTLEVSS